MNWKQEYKFFLLIGAVFAAAFWLPFGTPRLDNAVLEAFHLLQEYAREHVILCLVPAFFIAGGISIFVSQNSVIRYLGGQAKKIVAYGVASVSGSVLAVCSCTVLPLFSGIYRMGAGLGPATTFLYAGPAINVMAIILTARVLGVQLGIARAVGAVVFSIVIGLLMQLLFRREEAERQAAQMQLPEDPDARPLWQNTVFFGLLVLILIFANLGKPQGDGFWAGVQSVKWWLTGAAALGLGAALIRWFKMAWWKITLIALPTIIVAVLLPSMPLLAFGVAIVSFSHFTSTSHGESADWFEASWGFAKQILPLLFFGILVAGVLLGRPGHEGVIPSQWVAGAVGGNSLGANLFASIAGAFMYFATLTEVPILQGLLSSGMGQGPALALLLAGPALSLPNMLVIRSVLGMKKTVVFVMLVVVMATTTGMFYGALV